MVTDGDSERVCQWEELTREAETYLLPRVEEAVALGYSDGQLRIAVRNLIPSIKQGFGYHALHRDGQRYLTIMYILNEQTPGNPHHVQIAVSVFHPDGPHMDFIGDKTYMDSDGLVRKTLVKPATVANINDAAQAHLIKNSARVRNFRSFADAFPFVMSVEDQIWETRIKRGLCQFVSAEL